MAANAKHQLSLKEWKDTFNTLYLEATSLSIEEIFEEDILDYYSSMTPTEAVDYEIEKYGLDDYRRGYPRGV